MKLFKELNCRLKLEYIRLTDINRLNMIWHLRPYGLVDEVEPESDEVQA